MSTLLLCTDRQQSVMRGHSSQPRAYSPYGDVKAAPIPGLAFCGQYRDSLTGHYPLGNGRRCYSPVLMRFISPDSLSPFSRGGINGYAYCGGDPVNRHDPSGAFWSVLLRTIGVASSGATLFGSLARTAQNVVKRRAAFQAAGGGSSGETPMAPQELLHASRVSNQQFFITGSAGTAGQVVAAISGMRPTFQSATDVLGVVNAVTNLSGGLIGNFTAAREVVTYLRAKPREIPSVALETIMDVTMIDEMLAAFGRGFAYVGQGLTSAAARIRSWRTPPHDVQI